MPRNRKKNKQPKHAATANTTLPAKEGLTQACLPDALTLAQLYENNSLLRTNPPSAAVAQDLPLRSTIHHQRKRRPRHICNLEPASAPHPPILTSTYPCASDFTEAKLERLAENHIFCAERKQLPGYARALGYLEDLLSDENVPEHVREYVREREKEVLSEDQSGTSLQGVEWKPGGPVREPVPGQIADGRRRRQDTAGRRYACHAPAVMHPPTLKKPVFTDADMVTAHMPTRVLAPASRQEQAVKTGARQLARVYNETMALWHTPLWVAHIEEAAPIVQRMEENNKVLEVVFRGGSRTPEPACRDENEPIKSTGSLGNMEERGTVHPADASSLGGGDDVGFAVDERKGMLAIAAGMAMKDQHDVGAATPTSGGGYTEREGEDDRYPNIGWSFLGPASMGVGEKFTTVPVEKDSSSLGFEGDLDIVEQRLRQGNTREQIARWIEAIWMYPK